MNRDPTRLCRRVLWFTRSRTDGALASKAAEAARPTR